MNRGKGDVKTVEHQNEDELPPPRPQPKTKSDDAAGDVGAALQNAFQATVEEPIPQDLLDLLNRLG